MKRVYREYFSDWADVTSSFTAPNGEKLEPGRVWAMYENGGYDGSAAVVFKRGRKVYVNQGSHCSCYGLEDQWGPVEYASVAEFERCAAKETYGLVHDNLTEILATLRAR